MISQRKSPAIAHYIYVMKSLLVFVSCFGLTLALATAKPKKEEEGKHGGQGKHARQTQIIGGKGGKHAHQMNAGHQQQAAHHRFAEGEGGASRAQIKHFNFDNTRNARIKSVTFKQNRRIVGAEHWSGDHYVVFRSYRSVWHDRGWWHAHYPRIVLIGGGWYYLNAGFWFPAWGYDSGANFYAYDGPIYAYNDLPPDQVVANVQTELQAQGYYHGEVDGLLGPLSRAALADYQRDHGLYTTAAIDEPTMQSLGFS